MHSIFVTIRIKPGFADRFTEASFGDGQGSVRDEPGCFRFDILKNSSDPNLFHLYEMRQPIDDACNHRGKYQMGPVWISDEGDHCPKE